MSSNKHSKWGFTLIELLVVIGIIGILSGVMLTTFGGASESAKAAKCMTNMRNLAVAVHSSAMASSGVFPSASPYERLTARGYDERNGWISWAVPRQGAYPYRERKERGRTRTAKTSQVSSSWFTYLAYRPDNKSDYDTHRDVLTNGLVWAHCGRNSETYVCPKHLEAFRKPDKANKSAKGYRPCWSYVMNSYFGYDNSGGKTMGDQLRYISGLKSLRSGVPIATDKVLLFAEVPFDRACPIQSDVKLMGEDTQHDSVLQYAEKREGNKGWSGYAEHIGFNHKASKRWMGHVAFADGHVARMMLPREASVSDMQDLTTWLCQGDEVVFQGDRYERVNQVDQKLN